jgi:hypothetical protein
VVEPTGELYIPYVGTVTPNGHFTNDSYADQVSFEGYFTNRYIQPGEYRFYANLYMDPHDFQPQYDILWRRSQSDDLTSIYSPNYPVLSKEISWLSDPTPTWEEIHDGAYTDLQWAASLTVNALRAVPEVLPGVQGSAWGEQAGRSAGPTPVQLAKAREVVKHYREMGSTPVHHGDIAAIRAMLNARGR